MAGMQRIPWRTVVREVVPVPARTFASTAVRRVRHGNPGLLMWYASPSVAPPPDVPGRFSLRTWAPGDNPAWLRLLNESAAFGEWDAARLARETKGLIPGTQVFVTDGTALVAGTGAFERGVLGRAGLELGWVVRDPSVRGAALGESAFIACLRAAAAIAAGRPIFLYTDDHRLTAIELYLRSGFVPDLRADRAYPLRWERVFRALARRRAHAQSPRAEAIEAREPAPS